MSAVGVANALLRRALSECVAWRNSHTLAPNSSQFRPKISLITPNSGIPGNLGTRVSIALRPSMTYA